MTIVVIPHWHRKTLAENTLVQDVTLLVFLQQEMFPLSSHILDVKVQPLHVVNILPCTGHSQTDVTSHLQIYVQYTQHILTGANAIDSIVCILAETDLGKTGSFPISWLPANVQNFTWPTPTLTIWTSESGRNWARNVRLHPPPVEAILMPKITHKCIHRLVQTNCRYSNFKPANFISFNIVTMIFRGSKLKNWDYNYHRTYQVTY